MSLVFTALLLAAAEIGASQVVAGEMVGQWAEGLVRCNSDEAIRFYPDGESVWSMTPSKWRLSRGRLQFFDVDRQKRAVVTADVQIQRVSRDEHTWTYKDGRRLTFLRCPE